MTGVRAVGFDVGFTLVTHSLEPAACLAEACQAAGRDRSPAECAAAMPPTAGLSGALTAAASRGASGWGGVLGQWYGQWAQAVGLTGAPAARVARAALRRYGAASNWVPVEGASAALRACADLGLPVGLLSNWGPGLRGMIAGLGWDPMLATVLASSDIGAGKPDRAAFEFLCRCLGRRADEVLYVGDDPVVDHDGAVAAGLQAVLIGPSGGPRRTSVASLDALVPLLAERLAAPTGSLDSSAGF